jgi:hypothetical protein
VGSIRTTDAAPARPEGINVTDEQRDQNDDVEAAEPAEAVEPEQAPQYGVGPFTVRELALVGVWVVAFVVSFFSIYTDRRFTLLPEGASDSVWTSGLEWVLTIGVPTVAVFLIILRRFSPDGIRRVGSLGIDQFASVAFSVAAVVWLVWLWSNVGTAIARDAWPYSWVVWVEFFLMLAGVVLTVFAPFIPTLEQDFQSRREVPAHRNARPVRAVAKRPPRPPRPARAVDDESHDGEALAAVALAPEQDSYAGYGAYGDQDPTLVDQPVAVDSESWARADERTAFQPVEPVQDTRPRQQAFWALAPDERNVVDESGIPIFRIGPSAWALVIEDRGDTFVVRNEDGRIGYLHDISGVTRG